WPIALRLVNARHQSTRWIAAKLDIPDFDLVMLRRIVRGCHVDSSLRVGFSLSYALSMPSHIEKPPSLSKQKLPSNTERRRSQWSDALLDAMPSPCYSQGIILTPRRKDIDRQYFFSPAVETFSAFTFDSSRRASSADPRSCSFGNATAVSGSPWCVASV